MKNGLNQCQFIGRLGRDPETNNGVCKFSVAVGESYTDKNGQQVEHTEWVNCVTFSKLAEISQAYLAKGSLVFVSGKLKTNKFTGRDGVEKTASSLTVNTMKILSSNNEGQKKTTTDDMFNDDIPF